jgi:chromosome partitioning protein
MKIISVTNAKGGVGKTTASVNLAYELRQRGHLVLLIDLDDQCDLTKIYRPLDDASPDILHVLQGQNHILDACVEADSNQSISRFFIRRVIIFFASFGIVVSVVISTVSPTIARAHRPL